MDKYVVRYYKKRGRKSVIYEDITEQFKEQVNKKCTVIEQQYYTDSNGVRYNVDNKYVVYEHTEREKQVANILGGFYGGQVKIIPKVNNPLNIKTPDYIINGEKFDLKQITGEGKYVIEGNLRKKKEQSQNFVIDITNSKIKIVEVERQIKSIYISKRYKWVDKILVLNKNNIIKIYARKSTANRK